MQTSSETTTGITSDTSETASEWRNSLPEQLRDAPYFKNAQSLEQARQEIDNAAYWQGNSILKPGANASDEAKAANRDKILELYKDQVMPIPTPENESEVLSVLGLPDAADKYELPEGFEMDPAEAGLLKAIALDSKLTKSQFKQQQQAILSKRKEMAEKRQHELETGMAAYRNELGAAFDETIKQVGTLVNNDPDIPQFIKDAYGKNQLDAATTKWLAKIAQSGDEMSEAPSQQGQTSVMTPEEAKQTAAEIRQRMHTMGDLDPMRPILMKKLIEAESYSIGQRPH